MNINDAMNAQMSVNSGVGYIEPETFVLRRPMPYGRNISKADMDAAHKAIVEANDALISFTGVSLLYHMRSNGASVESMSLIEKIIGA